MIEPEYMLCLHYLEIIYETLIEMKLKRLPIGFNVFSSRTKTIFISNLFNMFMMFSPFKFTDGVTELQ